MSEQIFYHFWSTTYEMAPFDLNQSYSYSTRANDERFLKQFVDYRKYGGQSYLEYTFDLLELYLDVLYDNNDPDKLKKDALYWIEHTESILKESNEDFNFLHDNKIVKIIDNFKPNTYIKVNIIDKSTSKTKSFLRTDPFFNQFGAENKPVKNEEIELDNIEKIPTKIKMIVIFEILKQLEKGKAYNDVTKMCRLVSFLTGASEKKIINYSMKRFRFTNYHNEHIDNINQN